MNGRLVIFTRYPEAGTTKTRLIPVLGEKGAAQLQRYLTEATLKQAKIFQPGENWQIVVYFSGGNQQLMENWLGSDLDYLPQCQGDLGERMKAAFRDAFAEQITRVILIGTDCPQLDYTILEEASKALNQNNLVIGSAADGGYYLIGLNRFIPEVFDGILWGTDQVFRETIKIANYLNLKVSYLKTLTDLDRPEDLGRLQGLISKNFPLTKFQEFG